LAEVRFCVFNAGTATVTFTEINIIELDMMSRIKIKVSVVH